MKSIYSKLVLVSLLLVSLSGSVYARECIECKRTNAKHAVVKSKAAACKRAQSTAELNINNVRALINGYGNMWYDGSVAQYHLPKNNNTCPLFCAALWIGGTDVNDQLRIAALRFGSEGDDYWPGPLKINGTATITPEVCNYYDQHWIITKAEVLSLMEHFSYGDSTVTRISDPSSDITDVIRNWPAHGHGDDLTSYLAPFFDADNDGVYNPDQGDYPYYDFENKLCPRTLKALNPDKNIVAIPTRETRENIVKGGILSDQVLKGDQTIWWVFNDMGNTHTETQGQPIGLEIRAQAFAFSTNDEINNMTFYSYEIINRSTYELRETYFSQWVDPDLGYAWDDYVGCDVRRGLGYCYNGKATDTPGSGSYTGIPPAVGIDFFQGPYMDADGKDNPKIDIPWIKDHGSAPLQQLLATYARTDSLGRFEYDTIALSYDADKFFAIDPMSWYNPKNHPGDRIGNCAINGVNFGNNIIDDERFGMRRFVYYDNGSSSINGEPSKASDYYNYLRGYWKDNRRMKFGGNAISKGTTDYECDFMFPGDSDPWDWGTDGQDPGVDYGSRGWTDQTAGNDPNDRRFMQSAGPFTLKPGALNYITVGIPFAQATSGEPWSSVEMLRQIDDVCQALFENCFKVLDGPDAPTLTAQELSNEIILYLTYENPQSNNYGESYSEMDPSIVSSYYDEELDSLISYPQDALKYKFEGYQIYQLVDANASIADINDPTKARLVAQCDIENYYDTLIGTRVAYLTSSGDTAYKMNYTVNTNPTLPIGTLVNYTTNSATGILSGEVMVQGANKGIQHVFRITNDQFATGSTSKLVNNREYYFIAVAYAHNRYKEYSQTDASYLDGQKEPYLAGRKNERGGSITPITVIPHSPAAEDGGKVAQAEFGLCPNVIRLGGYGNGGSILRLSESSIQELMGAPGQPGMAPGTLTDGMNFTTGIDASKMTNPCIIANPMYEENYGPINVRVIDPLKVHEGRYNILIANAHRDANKNWVCDNTLGIDSTTRWCIVSEDPTKHFDSVVENGVTKYIDTIWSDFLLSRYNEQLFLDLGLAVTLVNPKKIASDMNYVTGKGYYGGYVSKGALIGSERLFADDHKQWLSAVSDNDASVLTNWIRSGAQFAGSTYKNFISGSTPYSLSEPYLDEDFFKSTEGRGTALETFPMDKEQVFEGVVGGTWAPYNLVSRLPFHPGFNLSYYMASDDTLQAYGINKYNLQRQLMAVKYDYSFNFNDMSNLPSVRVVFTSDTSKWTRCPVIEECDDHTQSEGNARRFSARKHASVNKLGKTKAEMIAQGLSFVAGSVDDPEYIAANGMGWFPGYAINTVTGERLNIMFGEDSRYAQYNGADMMWNPTSNSVEGVDNYVFGGRHYIYVMNATRHPYYNLAFPGGSIRMTQYVTPSYDAGRWAMKMLGTADRIMSQTLTLGMPALRHGIVMPLNNEQDHIPACDSLALLYASVAWVNMPFVNPASITGNTSSASWNPMQIPCDVTVNIDVRAPYGTYMSSNHTSSTDVGMSAPKNIEMPAYQFVLNPSDAVLVGLATSSNAHQDYIDSLLGQINVVPNPYYSYSQYETSSQLETKVRIVNLPTGIENGRPQGCLIRIYTVDGTLVRTLGPTAVSREVTTGHYAESTTVDWDLHNQSGIPIAGGMYLIHVSVPGIGERVIKWFGTMRPVDLNSFQF